MTEIWGKLNGWGKFIIVLITVGGLFTSMGVAWENLSNGNNHTAEAVKVLKVEHKEDVKEIVDRQEAFMAKQEILQEGARRERAELKTDTAVTRTIVERIDKKIDDISR